MRSIGVACSRPKAKLGTALRGAFLIRRLEEALHPIVSSFDRVGGLADAVSGKGQRLDFRCRRCGYGIVVRQPPAEGCPMCHTTSWVVTGSQKMQDMHPAVARRRSAPAEAGQMKLVAVSPSSGREQR